MAITHVDKVSVGMPDENCRQATMDFGHKTERGYPHKHDNLEWPTGDPAIEMHRFDEQTDTVLTGRDSTSLEALSTRLHSAAETMYKFEAILCNKTDSILGAKPETETTGKAARGASLEDNDPSLYRLQNVADLLERSLANLGDEVHRYAECGL